MEHCNFYLSGSVFRGTVFYLVIGYMKRIVSHKNENMTCSLLHLLNFYRLLQRSSESGGIALEILNRQFERNDVERRQMNVQ